jgi:hypothetical protein
MTGRGGVTTSTGGEAVPGSGKGVDNASDGNKSLYLVFVGVVFLSILDCF